ncbi:hypothetical protein [Marinicella rhabdoformis]|uniref:hypothetical protein n=1 Tax=Marinicella rhabdoformis TaxID=2580566 RepID=UPI0012AECFFF|nr:hypothetical protein [Marinicella rhabdoformis]
MKKIMTLMMLMVTCHVSAFTPESGWWWNPSEPGTGYAIEIQDNMLFAAFYVYDEDGNPLWYTAQKKLDGNSYFDSGLNYSYDGTCIDCNYSEPITVGGVGGPVTIDFITETTGTIQFGGVIKNIERYNYFLGDELQKMRGEWQVVMDVSDYTNDYPFIADVLIFDQTETFQGDYLVTGCRSENTGYNGCTNYALTYNDLAAYYDPQYNELIAVVRDDADYYLAYYLKTGTDQFDGEAYSYLVGSSPNFNADGFSVRGFRSASYTFVATGTGPSKSESNGERARPGVASMIEQKVIKKAKPMDKAKADRLHDIIKRLEGRLESQQDR